MSHRGLRHLDRSLRDLGSGVPGQMWKDAWINLVQCLDMAQSRAIYVTQHMDAKVLVRTRSLVQFILRGTWRSQAPRWRRRRLDWSLISCCVKWRDGHEWAMYRQRVGGYHDSEFVTAVQDLNRLATHLRDVRGLERFLAWLSVCRRHLERNVTRSHLLS